MSPLFPFGLLNYALGLTRIRLRAYVIATATGILPGTFLYVYLGSAVKPGLVRAKQVTREAFFWFGLMATLGLHRAARTRVAPLSGSCTPMRTRRSLESSVQILPTTHTPNPRRPRSSWIGTLHGPKTDTSSW